MYVNKSIVEIYIPLLLVVYDIFKNRALVGAPSPIIKFCPAMTSILNFWSWQKQTFGRSITAKFDVKFVVFFK
jgi:hypothetical protein